MRCTRRVVWALLLVFVVVVTAACGSVSPTATSNPITSGQQQTQPQQQTGQQANPQPPAEQPKDEERSAEPALPASVTEAKVVRVIDGDTIEVAYVAGAQLPATRVRLIGINTPESTTRVEPFGKEASAYTERQLEGKTVWLEKDVSETDRYGRALRYVWLTKPPAEPTDKDIRTHLFNAILVLAGYAQVATYPPDVKYVDYFIRFQREAREANRGLWSLDDTTRGSSSQNAGGSSSGSSGQKCDPNYSGACVPPCPPDVDCGDISAKGFRVVSTDVHRLDQDKDGIACE